MTNKQYLVILGIVALIAVAIWIFVIDLATSTPAPVEATMAVVRETVVAEVTSQAATQVACPAPKGPFYDQEMGRSYIPMWTFWEGRGVTVISRGASYQFSLDPRGAVTVLPLGTGSSFSSGVDRWSQDQNLIQVFRLTNAQGENAGKVVVYFCPDGGHYLSDVLYP